MLMTNNRSGREGGGVTDGAGNLEIKNLKAGKYYAMVNAPGAVSPLAYVDLRRSRADSFDEQMAGFTPIIVDGISEIITQIPVRRGGAISGRVTYSDGDAAIGVKVEVLRKVGEEYLATIPNFSALASMFTGGAGSLQTDDRGYYRFAGLPAGEYIVKVSENVIHTTNRQNEYMDPFGSMLLGSGSMVNIFFQDAFDKSEADPIQIVFGQEQSEINIVVPDRELRGISGKVLSAKDKLPIRNVRIRIQRVGDVNSGFFGDQEALRQNSVSDNDGNWAFNELPKGTYKLIAEAPVSEFDEVAQAYGRRASDLRLDDANMASNAIYSAVNGKAKIVMTKQFAKKRQEITIEDKDMTEIVVEMNFGATIMGSVAAEDGKELPGSVTIMATNEDAEISSQGGVYHYNIGGDAGKKQPKPNSEFEIEGITSGKTFLTVHTSNSEYYVKSAVAGGKDLLKDGFDLAEGEEIRGVKIILAKDVGTLRGSIVGSDGRPASGVSVTLVPTDPVKFRNSSYYRSVRSDENGEFEVKLAPMEYAVVSFPDKSAEKGRDDFYGWLGNVVKTAQTVKIASGKTSSITIARDSK